MNWNDLKSTWRQQGPSPGKNSDLASLEQTFEARSRKQARRLLWHELRQVAAGLFVAGYLAYLGYTPRLNSYRSSLGVAALLSLVIPIYFWLEFLRRRRSRLQPDASLLAKLEADLAELHHQRRLMLVVAPRLLALILVTVSVVLCAPLMANGAFTPKQARVAATFAGVFLVLLCAAHGRNRWDARQRVEPRIRELERLRDDLLSKQ